MEYVGLRWYKCDFHLHTMNSKCYKNKEDSIKDWVDEVKKKNIQCIAVTDHNDYRGIGDVQQICKEEEIIVFPAVELSCDTSKVHMLILFDVDCSEDDVRDFITQVGITKDKLGDSANTGKGTIFEVCEKAQQEGALVIAAHIDEFNGINEFSHDNISNILDRKFINAVQIVNESIWSKFEQSNNFNDALVLLEEKYGRSISEDIAKKWYKTYKMAKEKEIPLLTFSDNPSSKTESTHGLWGIGRNYTWIKMNQAPDLESVRQALLSFDMRVKNDNEYPTKPDIEPDLWVKSINISKTVLNDQEDICIDFNPQLNTIIGGRGSGKSSIIRVIAGGLQSFDADDIAVIKKEQEDFYKLEDKEKRGVMKKDSNIELYVERKGDLYKIQISDIKNMNSQDRKLFRLSNDKETWDEIDDINYFDFFKCDIYTQKQIYEIARDTNSILNIIDDDIDDLNEKIMERDSLMDELISKWLEIWNYEKTIEAEGRIKTELNDINEQINKFEQSGISEALRIKQKYDSESKIIGDYFELRKKNINKFDEMIKDIMDDDMKEPEIEDTIINNIIKTDLTKFYERKNEISNIISKMIKDLDDTKEIIKISEWQKQRHKAENEYNNVCGQLKQQGIELEKLDELLRSKKNKTTELDNINLIKKTIVKAENEQRVLYKKYEEIIDEISNLRADFINEIIGKNSNVKFRIQHKRNKNSFIEMMKSVLNKDNATIHDDINKMSELFFQNNGIEKFRDEMHDIRCGRNTKSYSKFTRNSIVEMQPESFARMISYIAEDDLKVSYKPEKSKKYIPLSNASAGQKTTAILTFLLAYGDAPLLLDQPEDDLDNKLVYDLIVTRLKEAKSKRQIIVVTHNANIPVNGDAEHIISMDSETDKINVKYNGTMDDKLIREEICDVMEGTQYAFEMRAKKYHFKIVE